MPVRIGLGQTAFTRIPADAKSMAADRTRSRGSGLGRGVRPAPRLAAGAGDESDRLRWHVLTSLVSDGLHRLQKDAEEGSATAAGL